MTAVQADRIETGDLPAGAFGGLLPELRRAVVNEGYRTPTPIQEQSIPSLLAGRDLIGTAQTGTGKTAAFILPLLQQLHAAGGRPRPNAPRALILAPTRELAAQIGESIRVYGRFLRLRHTVIFGGVGQHPQVSAMKRGVDILVATPGRLLDLMQQGHIRLGGVEFLVLDEVDRMLDMGFIHDIRRVLAVVPEDRQTLFFSATMPPNMLALAEGMVRRAVRVSITPEQPAVERIAQKVMFVGKQDKNRLLVGLLGDPEVRKVIVFTRMKHVANRVAKVLEGAGIRAAALHGNKSQTARTRALDGFKRGGFRVLVATDVAARGLDVDDITHVVNYDLPVEAETYVHRIGRTARAGAGGDAISFCSSEERACLRDIERLLGAPVAADLEHDLHCEEAYRSKKAAGPARGRSRVIPGRGRGHGRVANAHRRSRSGYRR